MQSTALMAGKKPAMAKAAAKRAGGQGQPTNWLAPLSAQQVTQQAANTVRSAYNPLYGSLDQQTKQLLAVRQKQDADNQYYQQWLDSKSAALSAAQSAVDQTTNDLETKLTGNQATVFAAEPDQLISAANARAGNVSNNAQSNTFGSELAATQAPLRESLSGTATQSLDMEKNAEAQNVASSAQPGRSGRTDTPVYSVPSPTGGIFRGPTSAPGLARTQRRGRKFRFVQR